MIPDALFQVRPANNQSTYHYRSRNILFAESDRELRRLLSFVLRSDGHQVTESGDGGELLHLVGLWMNGRESSALDLVMAAQDMPGATGICSLTALRARGRRTPFILLTEDPKVRADARNLDAVVLGGRLNVVSIRQAVGEAEMMARWGRRVAG